MRTVFKIFFTADGASPWIAMACLLSASVAQGIGLASLLPLLVVATGSPDDTSPVMAAARGALEAIGVPLAIGPLLVLLVGAVVLKGLLTLLAMRYVGYAVAEVTTRLRLNLTRALVGVRWGYFARQPAGRINHALLGLTGATGQAYAAAARFVAQSVETTILTAVALIISWQVTLAGAALGLATIAALNWFVRRSRRAGRKQIQRQRELAVLWAKAMANLKPLKAMDRHQAFLALFERKVFEWRKMARQLVINREARSSIQDILFALMFGVGCYVALVIWTVPIVNLIVVGVVLSRTVRSVGRLQEQYQTAVTLEYAYLELQALMAEIAEMREAHSGSRRPTFERACRFEDVRFAHGSDGRRPVLDGVTFAIPARGVTVLTGPSGAGKTTLCDLVLGLYTPQAGRITLDDVPLTEIDLPRWRRMIGYAPQELVLVHGTVFDNVQLGDAAIDAGRVERALRLADAWDFVSRLPNGMATRIGEGGTGFSGGQRQRIALARALVTEPKLVILDEVTSALDPETERRVCANLRRLADSTAVLAITHRPAFLDIADTVYAVGDGKVTRLPGVAAPMAPVAGGVGRGASTLAPSPPSR